jgi:hypothetical protein
MYICANTCNTDSLCYVLEILVEIIFEILIVDFLLISPFFLSITFDKMGNCEYVYQRCWWTVATTL